MAAELNEHSPAYPEISKDPPSEPIMEVEDSSLNNMAAELNEHSPAYPKIVPPLEPIMEDKDSSLNNMAVELNEHSPAYPEISKDPPSEPIMEVEDSSDQKLSEEPLSTSTDKPVIHSETLKIACTQLFEMYIEEEYFNLGREIWQRLRWGEFDGLGVLNDVPDECRIGVDIFGNPLSKKNNFVCECPRCNRKLAASRFAAHLEKCMGIGRSSSRVASRRIAASASSNNNNSGNQSTSSADSNKNSAQGSSSSGQNANALNGELGSKDDHFEEDDDDEDWALGRKKKSKKASGKVAAKRFGGK